MTALLEGAGVGKSFGSTAALTAASLQVGAGEIVAVMGPSGSGKSTFLHCHAGIIRPDTGRVTYRDRDLGALSGAERSALRRGEFGFVFQFGQLVPELTCRENAALPLRLDGVGRRDAECRALAWLERLEVADVAGKRPGEVSGGEGQGVAVAARCSPSRAWCSPTSRPARWTRSRGHRAGVGAARDRLRAGAPGPARHCRHGRVRRRRGVDGDRSLPALARLMRPDGLRTE